MADPMAIMDHMEAMVVVAAAQTADMIVVAKKATAAVVVAVDAERATLADQVSRCSSHQSPHSVCLYFP